MEWLSHSQKKYCELCKTSFRFTKLYAPDMPQSLPVHIFIEHMTKYLFRNLLVWLRAILAISIWICWLPLFMRAVWSFMFWISDEGLGGTLLSLRDEKSAWETSLFHLITSACPSSPLIEKTTTTLAEAAAMLKHLPGDASGIPKYVVKSMRHGSFAANGTDSWKSFMDENGTMTIVYDIDSPSASLLSNVTFLRTLTQSPRVNRAVMSIIEGQIITILVIVCFILIILVRDYVVQQQPELNMRAAFADQEDADQADAAFDAEEAPHAHDHNEALDNDLHAIAPEFERHLNNAPLQRAANRQPPETDDQEAINQIHDVNLRPEIHDPEYEPGLVMFYLRIYRRAHGDHREVLRIIHEEGLEDRLRFWVNATQDAINSNRENDERTEEMDDAALGAADARQWRGGAAASSSHQTGALESGSSSAREAAFPINRQQVESARESNQNFNGLRPRAASDGPSNINIVNPLANNSWTFEALPSETRDSNSTPIPQNSFAADSEGIFGEFMDHHEEASSSSVADPSPRPANRMTQRVPFEQDREEDMAAEMENMRAEIEQMREQIVDELPQAVPEAVPANEQADQPGIANTVANFMWGGLEHQEAELVMLDDAEQDADDDAWADIPDGDVDANNPLPAGDDPMQDAAGGFDQEAIDDMEDFEGVMELVGMRGPIAGLFQNAIFCSVLVSVTIFACIFVPYNIGRVTVWLMASPMRLVRMIVEISKLIQDALVMACAFISWGVINILEMFVFFLPGSLKTHMLSVRKSCWDLWIHAGARIFDYLFMDFPMSATEIQNFSAISHGALISLKAQSGCAFETLQGIVRAVYMNGMALPEAKHFAVVGAKATSLLQLVKASSSVLLTPDAWVINLGDAKAAEQVDPALARWSGTDRFWAILAGYAAVFSVAAMYLQRNSPFSTGQFMRAWEAGIIDTLHQASGIMKVILIISIEMLVFPLYCGMLLDLALLPLFENTTVISRVMFTHDYPATSIFVHWFVGTGYMFHFALFVSMCRKIMRPGVLYFIRDPDDPEFHPVRDVLDRNLITQLRKILFSAFVYGALVVICLGGVVWGLSLTLPSVLPIHYSSNEPVLEFPVDLLFYNFLMPLAVKFFKPGDGIHAMYTWWFRRCARSLRLTSFLFGDRRIDEEGRLQLEDSAGGGKSFRSFFLGLNEAHDAAVKSWKDAITGDVQVEGEEPESEVIKSRKAHLVESKQLLVDGRFVRAPASDRVKIAKGRKVFLTVDEENKRQDGNEDDDDLYGSDQYRNVYVPPSFRTRIFTFILFIWIFAAFTGVSLTILPLVIGRMIFKALIPDHVRTNDIYAFSIGIYLLGAVSYLAVHSRSVLVKVQSWMENAREEVRENRAASRMFSVLVHGLKLVYTYFFLAVVMPLLVSTLVELYVAMPLHTYMNPPTATTLGAPQTDHVSEGRHTVRLTQAWTLGLLYMKLGSKMITTVFPDTRAAVAVRSVLRRGWQRPDVGVFTRAFIVPGLVISAVAIVVPPVVATCLVKYQVFGFLPSAGDTAEELAKQAIFYRYSYPGAAVLLVMVKNAMLMANVFNRWTAGVRDEAYLIGERLHNFGAATAGARKGKGTWRAGTNRL